MNQRQSQHGRPVDPLDFEKVLVIGFNENAGEAAGPQDLQFHASLRGSEEEKMLVRAPKILGSF